MAVARRVAVIGAGIVGACAALELLRDGHAVTILDPAEPGGPQAASSGNGTWIGAASVVPMSTPGLWRRVPGFLLDSTGPLTIRPRALPHLAPWLLRFLLAGATTARVERTARALSALLSDAPARHAALAGETGLSDKVERRGLLYVYPDRAAFEAEALAWRLRRMVGVAWSELDDGMLRAREPDLSSRYRFGILVEAGAHVPDPGGYVAALVAEAVRRGAVLKRARATNFAVAARRLVAVGTDVGAVPCERAVIAAGIRSGALAQKLGDRIPLASERGYHVVVARPEGLPRTPLMPSDGRMANVMTPAGLRAAGQVELAHVDDPPDWRRADILLAHLARTWPGLPDPLPPGRVSRWMGHRPSTADGLPVIGPSRATDDVVHAFGHGHVGLAAGPITGRLVADLVSDREPSIPLAPYQSGRFRFWP